MTKFDISHPMVDDARLKEHSKSLSKLEEVKAM